MFVKMLKDHKSTHYIFQNRMLSPEKSFPNSDP